MVEKYLNGEIGMQEAVRLSGISSIGAFKQWISIYHNEGPTGLLDQKHYKRYSKETKAQAVNNYLDGKGSLADVAEQYGLRSKTQLRSWLKEYNIHGEIQSRGSEGGSYMRKGRKTSQKERLEIVQYCIAHDDNYGACCRT